jgi:hypothetical protein
MADENCVVLAPETATVPYKKNQKESGQVVLRNQKIADHYGGKENSLTSRAYSGNFSGEELLRDLVTELFKEIDNLAGVQMMATENGDLQASTIIATKRTEIIDRAIKAIMHKKEFEAQNSIDVESPSMLIVFSYFLEKCNDAFALAGFNEDTKNPFFHAFNDCVKEWKKELKKRILELKT